MMGGREADDRRHFRCICAAQSTSALGADAWQKLLGRCATLHVLKAGDLTWMTHVDQLSGNMPPERSSRKCMWRLNPDCAP